MSQQTTSPAHPDTPTLEIVNRERKVVGLPLLPENASREEIHKGGEEAQRVRIWQKTLSWMPCKEMPPKQENETELGSFDYGDFKIVMRSYPATTGETHWVLYLSPGLIWHGGMKVFEFSLEKACERFKEYIGIAIGRSNNPPPNSLRITPQ